MVKYFQIVHEITVITPSSYLIVGQSNFQITWTSSGYVGDVKIDLIRDGDPGTINMITSSYSGGSPFTWTSVSASDARRSDYRFKISSISYPSVVPSSSASPFEIDTEIKNITSVRIPTPYLYIGQKNARISWTSSGYVGNVMIELIRDGDGGAVDVIYSNYSGDSSPYLWPSVNASDAPRSDYKIQITSTSYPNISCNSSLFEIDLYIRCELFPIPSHPIPHHPPISSCLILFST